MSVNVSLFFFSLSFDPSSPFQNFATTAIHNTKTMDERDDDLASQQAQRTLPIANISRIMKGALPAHAKIARNAREAVQLSVADFISFVTSEALEHCYSDKRRTITCDDLLFAIESLGFEYYIPTLRKFLDTENLKVRAHSATKEEEDDD